MCKLLIMTGIKDSKLALNFMFKMAPLMSRVNDDGIGYTAVKSNGEIFSQRWLKNHHFFDTGKVMTEKIAKELKPYEDRLPKGSLEVNYSQYGKINYGDMTTVTMHTRFATCGKEFANTHPFIDKDTSLIHNGGISNHLSLGVNKISTCDSEAALQTYLSTGVDKDLHKAKEWLDKLQGRWAFGVLSRDAQGRRVLDVVRGYSLLYYMEIAGIGRIFTTDADDAKAVARELKLEFTQVPFMVDSNTMYRYDAVTGEFLDEPEIADSILNAPPKTTTETYYGSRKSVYGTWNEQGEFVPNKEETDVNKVLPSESEMNAGNGYSSAEDDTSFLKREDGKWDHKKVKTYVEDSNEDFLERLCVWDECHGTDLTTLFMSMNDAQMSAVEEEDFRSGFFEAKRMIVQIIGFNKFVSKRA